MKDLLRFSNNIVQQIGADLVRQIAENQHKMKETLQAIISFGPGLGYLRVHPVTGLPGLPFFNNFALKFTHPDVYQTTLYQLPRGSSVLY